MMRMAAIESSRFLLTCGLWMATLAGTGWADARQAMPVTPEATIAVTELPRQGQETYQLIRQGGPFPYEKDGSVFGNRERLLPVKQRGYYREYTVRTPGSRDRGGRRIVCGGHQPRIPVSCYYSSDHYASFRQIIE